MELASRREPQFGLRSHRQRFQGDTHALLPELNEFDKSHRNSRIRLDCVKWRNPGIRDGLESA